MISFLSHKFGRGHPSSPGLYCTIGIGVLQGRSPFDRLHVYPFLLLYPTCLISEAVDGKTISLTNIPV